MTTRISFGRGPVAAVAVAGALAALAVPMTGTVRAETAKAETAKTEAGAFPVLTQPALTTPKAAGAAMLGLARAGQRLVAVGERGIILLSDDRGERWRQARVPVSVSLTAVRFVTERTGWAVGHFGVVLRTDDGGESWTKQLDGVAAARLVAQTAADLVRLGAPDAEGLRETSLRLVEEGPDKPFLDLFFANEREGIIVGAYNLAFRTQDGGRSWTPWMHRLDNPKGLHLYGIAKGQGPAAGDLYIVGEQGVLLRSTDGGERFTALPSPYKGSWFGALTTADGGLLAYGLRGSLYRSTDRGESWTAIDTGVASGIGAALALEGNRVVLASQTGDLLTSRDGGATVQPAPARKAPLTALADGGGGRLALASLRGVMTLDPSAPSRPAPSQSPASSQPPAQGSVR
ncbi:WD40/YVTN/BNR-like repeat-containing protein [Azospirillum griseum]|nr:YCF48-related protein [Azospirillum griseum]